MACLRWPLTTRKSFSMHLVACGASSITRPLPLIYFQNSLRYVNCNVSTKSFSTKGWISGIFVRESWRQGSWKILEPRKWKGLTVLRACIVLIQPLNENYSQEDKISLEGVCTMTNSTIPSTILEQ